ncbi:hypothetical protein BT69DRAFT_1356932 [Atractiella rhizophila]|nr:hypothetical protein BT69DRAFT_1356932 [Atractiella rhizophila]
MTLLLPTVFLLLFRLISFLASKKWLSRSLSRTSIHVTSNASSGLPSPSIAKREGEEGRWNVSEVVFCLSFSECSILLGLVVAGELIDESARDLNWMLSLALLIFLIVLLAPFLHCLLLTSPTSTTFRSLLYSAVPYGFYLFLFYRFGEYISTAIFTIDPSTSENLASHADRIHDFITPTLTRLLVPGVIIISSLSGLGAINTIWDEWELRRHSRQPVTDAHIMSAQRALQRAKEDVEKRERELGAVTREIQERGNSSKGFFGRLLTSDTQVARQSSITLQLSAMRELEAQLETDLMMLQARKKRLEDAKTLQGLFWSIVVRGLEGWCVYRVIVSILNLLFGYTVAPSSPSNATAGQSDFTTRILSRFLPEDFPLHFYARLLGSIMVGSILIASLRNVVRGVEGVFEWLIRRTTTSSTSAGKGRGRRGKEFVLLALSQVMAIYLLTSLVSLPLPPDSNEEESSSIDLLKTLPSFKIYSKLFDAIFLISAVGGLVWRIHTGFIQAALCMTGGRAEDPLRTGAKAIK